MEEVVVSVTSSIDFASFLLGIGYKLHCDPKIGARKYVIQFEMSQEDMDSRYQEFVVSPFYSFSCNSRMIRKKLSGAK